MTLARLILGATLATLTFLPAALHAEILHEGPSVSIPADQIGFGPTGVRTDVGELMAGPAYGDLTNGKHGTFIRMPAGFVSPEHDHTEDYFGIVINGVGVNGLAGSNDVPLPAGSYWFQRGEENHVTKCISDEDCLFFIYQPGAFDYVTAN
jgi:beta-alanine degradation protein BauB